MGDSGSMGLLYPTLPVAIALGIFGLLGRHALEMRTKQNYREMWGATTLSLLPAAIFCLWAASGESSMLTRNYLLIPAGAIIGACIFAYGGYVIADVLVAPIHRPTNDPTFRFYVEVQLVPSYQGPVTSYGQQGGITAGVVNIGPQARNLDLPSSDGLKQQMLSQLPRDKEITVTAILGDQEAMNFATQIHAFLKANGFKMKEPDGVSQALFNKPIQGLQFNPDTNDFIVGGK